MLQVANLNFEYDSTPLLHNVNFVLSKGELLYLSGSNGSGKTTLLKIIAGLISNHQGTVQLYNKCTSIKKSNNIAYVGHKLGVSLSLTINEHLKFELQDYKEQKCTNLLKSLGLSSHKETEIKNLSSGQQKKVSLMRFFLTEASLILLDEPFTSLDASTIDLVVNQINEKLEQGKMIILTSHQISQMQHLHYKEYLL